MKCDELLSRCHSAEEVKRMKDAHIAARINQYDDNKVQLIYHYELFSPNQESYLYDFSH